MKRETNESIVEAYIVDCDSPESEKSDRSDKSDKKGKAFTIDTGLNFLNHMIETISARSQLDISIRVQQKNYNLEHVICEDSGLTLGLALKDLIKKKLIQGIEGMGDATACIDEAIATACISYELRANSFIRRNCPASRLELVEDMKQSDLAAFIEGFSQGMSATIWLKLEEGKDPHHAWEAGFRALGLAIKRMLSPNRELKNKLACIKGDIL
ncbi:hypothetical protein K9M79_06205 [Candidatus Woesearchaeota archaeon]|nr:hypothetical protein [Candidatus Woesearchaeota archaeon]